MRSTIVGFTAIAMVAELSGCVTPLPTTPPTPTMSLEHDWLLFSGTDSLGDLVQGDEGAIRMTIADIKVTGQICNSWMESSTYRAVASTWNSVAATKPSRVSSRILPLERFEFRVRLLSLPSTQRLRQQKRLTCSYSRSTTLFRRPDEPPLRHHPG